MKTAKFALLALIGSLSFAPLSLALHSLAPLSLAPVSLSAQEPRHHHDADEKVGSVDLPLPVRPKFSRNSSVASRCCIRLSTKWPMGDSRRWPKRSALRHGLLGNGDDCLPELWDRPGKAALAQGAELLAKARSLPPPSAHERDYIQALSVFYSETDKLDHNQRADAYPKRCRAFTNAILTTTKPPSFTRFRFWPLVPSATPISPTPKPPLRY